MTSMIAVALPNKVRAVTCASPSNVLEVGALLNEYYDTHVLAMLLQEDGNISNLHTDAVTTEYFSRDLGENYEDHYPVDYPTYQAIISDSMQMDLEAVYILLKNGKWAVIELGEVGAQSARLLNNVLADKRRSGFRVVK